MNQHEKIAEAITVAGGSCRGWQHGIEPIDDPDLVDGLPCCPVCGEPMAGAGGDT